MRTTTILHHHRCGTPRARRADEPLRDTTLVEPELQCGICGAVAADLTEGLCTRCRRFTRWAASAAMARVEV